MATARLTVSRDSERDVGDRQVILTLDDQGWTTLLYGQSASREIAPGRHVLKADNTLFRKTLEFDAAEGEEVRLVVVSRKGPGSGLFLLLGAPLYYLDVRRSGTK